jgi:hypothetical protein
VPASNSSGAGFDWAATALGATFTSGVFLDGWAHAHGRVDDTFLTPWHAVLYSGFLAMAVLLVARAAWGVARHRVFWRRAMPEGYGPGLIGVACWLVGGPFDAVWHSVFGFEAGVEALMSPAHAILALGLVLMASGPLRAALARPPRTWWNELPMLLSLTFVVSILTFFTLIAHPAANLWGTRATRSHELTELGITGMLLTAATLTAPLLFLLRHDRLPTGGVTILVGLNAFAMGFLFDQGAYPRAVVAAIIAAAIAADVLRAALRPSPSRPGAFRVFAAVVATLPTAAYFTMLAATTGIAWSTHLWLGVVVFAAAVGWLLSYLLLAPHGGVQAARGA